ncbi:MAG: type II toxin-antitoxin system MqsA family antitoxin [Pseudoramibacter sp.]
MKCLSCKSGNMSPSTTTYFADLKNCMIIIKNVPCMKCEQCGDVLYSASVTERLYELMEKAESLASELTVIEYDKIA